MGEVDWDQIKPMFIPSMVREGLASVLGTLPFPTMQGIFPTNCSLLKIKLICLHSLQGRMNWVNHAHQLNHLIIWGAGTGIASNFTGRYAFILAAPAHEPFPAFAKERQTVTSEESTYDKMDQRICCTSRAQMGRVLPQPLLRMTSACAPRTASTAPVPAPGKCSSRTAS